MLEGKRLVHCHSYRADEILMMLGIAKEFGFRVATFQPGVRGVAIYAEGRRKRGHSVCVATALPPRPSARPWAPTA